MIILKQNEFEHKRNYNTGCIITIITVLAKKSSRFYILLQYKNVNFFWPVLYVQKISRILSIACQ